MLPIRFNFIEDDKVEVEIIGTGKKSVMVISDYMKKFGSLLDIDTVLFSLKTIAGNTRKSINEVESTCAKIHKGDTKNIDPTTIEYMLNREKELPVVLSKTVKMENQIEILEKIIAENSNSNENNS